MEITIKDLLIDELEFRKGKNRRYSLRAFARTLELSPAYLSQIVNGKRILSPKSAIQITRILGWKGKKKRLFLCLAERGRTKDSSHLTELTREIADLSGGTARFDDLKLNVFEVIARWYYGALLELRNLTDFKEDISWISKRLKLSNELTRFAIGRLNHLGLWGVPKKDFRIKDVPSEAIRLFHKEHLLQASSAIDSQEFGMRDFSGITMAISREKIPEAKALISDFREDLYNKLKGPGADSVYHLAVQFYRIDKE